jgi:hypothetical protein
MAARAALRHLAGQREQRLCWVCCLVSQAAAPEVWCQGGDMSLGGPSIIWQISWSPSVRLAIGRGRQSFSGEDTWIGALWRDHNPASICPSFPLISYRWSNLPAFTHWSEHHWSPAVWQPDVSQILWGRCVSSMTSVHCRQWWLWGKRSTTHCRRIDRLGHEWKQTSYVYLLAKHHVSDRIKEQSDSFCRGLWDVIKRPWLQLFNESELQVLISRASDGKIDVPDMKSN